MPELPEVEYARRLVETHCLNKLVRSFEMNEDHLVFPAVKLTEFPHQLDIATHEFNERYRVIDTGRHGKNFWIRFSPRQGGNDEDVLLLMHLGMAGKLHVEGHETIHYKEDPKKKNVQTISSMLKAYKKEEASENDHGEESLVQDAFPPRFHKFTLSVYDDENSGKVSKIALADPRRLARVRLVLAEPSLPNPVPNLGWDPILSWPPLEAFTQVLSKKSSPIKAVLLDQSVCAGVGNWVADEVLYQSRLHPSRASNGLTQEEVSLLHRTIEEVSRTAVSLNADSNQFPRHWLFHVRWAKASRDKTQQKDAYGNPVIFETVAGRTSAIVPALQHKSGSSISKSKKRTNVVEDVQQEKESKNEPTNSRKKRK